MDDPDDEPPIAEDIGNVSARGEGELIRPGRPDADDRADGASEASSEDENPAGDQPEAMLEGEEQFLEARQEEERVTVETVEEDSDDEEEEHVPQEERRTWTSAEATFMLPGRRLHEINWPSA